VQKSTNESGRTTATKHVRGIHTKRTTDQFHMHKSQTTAL